MCLHSACLLVYTAQEGLRGKTHVHLGTFEDSLDVTDGFLPLTVSFVCVSISVPQTNGIW